ncbi:MAG TPA: PmoA family protein [Verrucomicrobiales bacterium]|nr:PmoA family protein [Verrucomicrobiales bacterium]
MKKPPFSASGLAVLVFFGALGAASGDLGIRREGEVLHVEVDGAPFADLRHEGFRRPILYPIIGPHGVEMTRNYPMKEGVAGEAADHPHHQSLWYAHGDVNGVDFWSNRGKIVQIEVEEASANGNEALIVTRNRWETLDGKEVCRDKRRLRFSVLEEGARAIDFSITLEASNGDATFGDTKEGTLAIRTHPALRLKGEVATGRAVNSERQRDGELWGKAAKWVDYWGEVGGKTVGVAILDHPSNPRHPTTWHARDYGLVAVNPFGWNDFFEGKKGRGDLTIKGGSSLTFRYLFVFHEGDAETAKIREIYAKFSDS